MGLALDIQAERILLDDRAARRVAQDLGLLVTGTVGILLVAKRRGMLPAIRPALEALVAQSFFISAALYDDILRAAGEMDA